MSKYKSLRTSFDAMIKSIASIAVVVSNGKKSRQWYEKMLGLEVRDVEGHWITVAPKKSKQVLHLCESKTLEPGNTGILLLSDDIDAQYKDMKKKGVHFTQKLTKADWGSSAKFSDPDGNVFWLAEA